jgi:hypothetical protein
MHDGAPPHFILAVWEFLNSLFPEQWIGSRRPTASPDRSPHLNSFNFYLRGRLMSAVCDKAVNDVQDLQQRIENGFEVIRTVP